MLWQCCLGDRKGIRPVKILVLVCWWWWFDWSFAVARLTVPVVTIILSFSKTANQGSTGKIAVNMDRDGLEAMRVFGPKGQGRGPREWAWVDCAIFRFIITGCFTVTGKSKQWIDFNLDLITSRFDLTIGKIRLGCTLFIRDLIWNPSRFESQIAIPKLPRLFFVCWTIFNVLRTRRRCWGSWGSWPPENM